MVKEDRLDYTHNLSHNLKNTALKIINLEGRCTWQQYYFQACYTTSLCSLNDVGFMIHF